MISLQKQYFSSIQLVLLILSSIIMYVACADPLGSTVTIQKGIDYKLQFDLNNNGETLDLDVLGATSDFSFTLSKVTTNPYPDSKSPRSIPVFYLKLEINSSNYANLDFNSVFRYNYDDAYLPQNCSPDTLRFQVYRSSRWWYMESTQSNVDVGARIVTQGFSRRNSLISASTYISVYGGADNNLPDTGDTDIYNSFGKEYAITKTVSNKFQFQLPNDEVLELELTGSNNPFHFTLTKSSTNSHSSSFPDGADTALFFLSMAITENYKPTYNAVWRYKYKTLTNVKETSLNFVVYDSATSAWKKFKDEAERVTEAKILTQGGNSLNDMSSKPVDIAVVGAKGKSPTPSPAPGTGNSQAPRDSDASSSSSNSVTWLLLVILAVLSLITLH